MRSETYVKYEQMKKRKNFKLLKRRLLRGEGFRATNRVGGR
mgnify:CR=1 FL=1